MTNPHGLLTFIEFLFAAVEDSLSWWQWMLVFLATALSGVSKAGLKGIAVLIVTVFALAFGSKASTGIILPLLIVGDVLAVAYYSRHAQVRHLYRLLPWMALGVLIGVVFGNHLPEHIFKHLMAVVILISVGVMIWFDRSPVKAVPSHWSFALLMGLAAGFATMVGNLAGAFSTLYFLAMQFPKNKFIGTAAWLFMITNLFKVPFHIWVWQTITWETLKINLLLFPAVILGFFTGVTLVNRIPERSYRRLILVLTAIGASAMLFR